MSAKPTSSHGTTHTESPLAPIAPPDSRTAEERDRAARAAKPLRADATKEERDLYARRKK